MEMLWILALAGPIYDTVGRSEGIYNWLKKSFYLVGFTMAHDPITKVLPALERNGKPRVRLIRKPFNFDLEYKDQKTARSIF